MRILLDTNAYSDWRRKGRWNAVIRSATEVLVPAIVLGELRYGFEGAVHGTENRRKLEAFLANAVVTVLAVDDGTARVYANLKQFLRKAGSPIPENDIWIAALAVEHGVALATSDAHFARLPQVAKVMEE